MLQDTLSTIIETAKLLNLDQKHGFDDLLGFFSRRSSNEIIYPGLVKRKLGIGIKEAYFFLGELEKKGILRSCFEVYCPCGRTNSIIFDSIDEVSEVETCQYCGDDFTTKDHLIVIYKIV